MADYQTIYSNHADRYDALVSREDADGNLTRLLVEKLPLEGSDVVEMGCGTGRLTRLIGRSARSVRAFDQVEAMLRTARERTDPAMFPRVGFELGENGALPCESEIADLVVAGWTFGHATGWYPDRWRDVIEGALREARRVLRPSGQLAVIETLGTDQESPSPPRPALAAYYAMLERDYGFQRFWCRTDYQFESVEEAAELAGFFFGDALAKKIQGHGLTRIPECTGLWVASTKDFDARLLSSD